MTSALVCPSVQSLLAGVPHRRVLLINPPVHETNYRWLQWSQPLDLLKLGAWLHSESGSDVRLYDFLAPGKTGSTPRRKLVRQWDLHGTPIDAWHFGRPLEELGKTLQSWLRKDEWKPDLVLVTTLTSYWVSGLIGLLPTLRNQGGPYRDVPIGIIGNMPRYAPRQTQLIPGVTHIAPNGGAPIDQPAALELYSYMGLKPSFCALDVNNPRLVEEVESHLNAGVDNFTFFNDDIFGPQSRLESLASSQVIDAKKVSLDVLCGARPSTLTDARLEALRLIGVRSMCLDYETNPGGELLLDDYARIRDFTIHRDFLRREASLTAFINFGLPGESFDRIVGHTVLLNKWVGSIILKPFGAQWELMSEEQREQRWSRAEAQSPHAFPHMVENGCQVEDYFNLYRWQALLNYKNRGATFDFLSDTALGKTVRASIVEQSWDLNNIIKEGERAAGERKTHGTALPPARL